MTIDRLINKQAVLAVVGLGYVGLPVALSFSKKLKVIGFDINPARIDMLRNKIDPSNEMIAADFDHCDIYFTHEIEDLRKADFFILAVPTPVDEYHVPDLSLLKKACNIIGRVLKKGDYIVFESTVYPGCTEEDCIPIIEKESGLKMGKDFKAGYSPERINPGDKTHSLEKVIKVVSGCDAESLENIASVYSLIIEAGLHKAPSIKTAEAAKVIENVQRDLNIALMNELSLIFDKMDIKTYDVLEAAGTKWNFLKFSPGLVGGHCIGVDPYYLTYKASQLGFKSRVILSGRRVNDYMGNFVAEKIIRHLILHTKDVKSSKVLIMGATFKENVSDIRNSKVADIVMFLKNYHLEVHITDPYASSEDMLKEYGFSLMKEVDNDYDAVIVAVPHRDYFSFSEKYFMNITKEHAIIADLKGIYKGVIFQRKYWSL
ncbi:MAG: nucleotide sugar dehydrogenase [Bacteroidetes bacterium]|nr:nucleotide sugar dehydrogenase [Bacteroidota bacterium]